MSAIWQTGSAPKLRDVFALAALMRKITALDILDQLSLLALAVAVAHFGTVMFEAVYVAVTR